MQAGRYDRKISIEAYTETKGAYGNVVEGYTLFAEAWANKRTQGSREVFQAEQQTNINTAIYTIRYLPGVTPKMRIMDNGQEYKITGVMEIGRRKGLQIVAEHD